MTDETQTPAPGTTPETATENSGGKTPGSEGGDKPIMNQAEFERLMKERLMRDREVREKEFLTTYGVTSRDELKTALEAARKRDEADLSEAEKTKKALDKLTAERETAMKELQAEREARKAEKLDMAIIAAAKGAHNPKLVVSMLRDEQSDALTKAMKEDGTVDTAALDKLIADLRKKEGYLFGGSSPGSPSNSGGKAVEPDAKLKEEQRLRLRRQINSQS